MHSRVAIRRAICLRRHAGHRRPPPRGNSRVDRQAAALPRPPRLRSAGQVVLRRLPPRRDIAGAVLILPPENIADLEVLRASGTPFVVIDPRMCV